MNTRKASSSTAPRGSDLIENSRIDYCNNRPHGALAGHTGRVHPGAGLTDNNSHSLHSEWISYGVR
jgi:hypothetical protein